MGRKKRVNMTHEIILSSGNNESVLAIVKSEGIADQLRRTLSEQFESNIVVRPLEHQND